MTNDIKRPGEYDRNVGVDNSGFDYALEITLRGGDHGELTTRIVRIPVEDIPEFMADVVRHSAYALSQAARQLEAGHCETCGNSALIDTERNGRPWTERCPDCSRTQITPFKNAPHLGRKGSA